MCRTATPKAKQKLCDRCGKVRNPDDGWEHDWPLSGRIELLMHSCLPDYLFGTFFDTFGKQTHFPLPGQLLDNNNAVKAWGYQNLVIEWGNGLTSRHKRDFHSRKERPRKPYHLCCNCHEAFLRLIGQFFFNKRMAR